MSRGLKDHEISKLVNHLRDVVEPYVKVGCIRDVIKGGVRDSLEEQNLRYKNPTKPPKETHEKD